MLITVGIASAQLSATRARPVRSAVALAASIQASKKEDGSLANY
jgi:hypothetical protein